jgi:hypothetical protein
LVVAVKEAIRHLPVMVDDGLFADPVQGGHL